MFKYLVVSIIFFGTSLKSHVTIDQVRKANLQSLQWQDEDWSADSMYEWVTKLLKIQGSPTAHTKRNLAFTLWEQATVSQENRNRHVSSSIISPIEWQDLELLAGNKKRDYYLGGLHNHTCTELGFVALLSVLAQPTVDTDVIKQRQDIIRHIAYDPSLREQLASELSMLSEHENFTLSFWQKRDGYKRASDGLYYGLPLLSEKLNHSSWALSVGNYFSKLTASQIIFASCVAGTVLPLWALQRWGLISLPDVLSRLGEKNKHYIGGPIAPVYTLYNSFFSGEVIQTEMAFISGIFALLGLKGQVAWQRDLVVLEECLRKKMRAVAGYFKALRKIDQEGLSHPDLRHIDGYQKFRYALHVLPQKNKRVAQLFRLLESKTFVAQTNYLASRGDTLLAFKLMHDLKHELIPLFRFVGMLDMYCSVAQLMQDSKSKSVSFCFPTFAGQVEPFIDLSQFWNPFISSEKVVANDITIAHPTRDIVITGPNAAGKSTIMKAVALNVVLAQTFGIAAASKMVLTPFDKIITYMNVTDDIASGNSGFMASVRRAQDCLAQVEALQDGQHGLIVMDEAFRETNPVEAQAAAYALAQELGKLPSTITLIATHFHRLTELVDKCASFENYKVSVDKYRDGTLHYPFKLEPGVSRQYVALDILRQQGFSGSLLDTAEQVVSVELF